MMSIHSYINTSNRIEKENLCSQQSLLLFSINKMLSYMSICKYVIKFQLYIQSIFLSLLWSVRRLLLLLLQVYKCKKKVPSMIIVVVVVGSTDYFFFRSFVVVIERNMFYLILNLLSCCCFLDGFFFKSLVLDFIVLFYYVLRLDFLSIQFNLLVSFISHFQQQQEQQQKSTISISRLILSHCPREREMTERLPQRPLIFLLFSSLF